MRETDMEVRSRAIEVWPAVAAGGVGRRVGVDGMVEVDRNLE